MNEVVKIADVTEVAKGISDYGVLIVIAAAFIVLSFLMWGTMFKWFKSIIDSTIGSSAQVMNSLLAKTEAQNDLLNEIAGGLRPANLMQIKSITNTSFDLSVEQTCRIIRKVKEENHIADKEATRLKIRTLVTNMHDDRNSRLDNIHYRGKDISSYTRKEWVDWVSDVIEKEVYAEETNEARTYTNVDAIYKRIRIAFYHNLTGQNQQAS